MLVVDGKKKIQDFKKYCKKENIRIITWLNSKNLNLIKKKISEKIVIRFLVNKLFNIYEKIIRFIILFFLQW